MLDIAEVPLGGNGSDRAVEVPRPGMKRTAEYPDLATAFGQCGAAVSTRVVERLDRVLRRSHHDEPDVDDFVGDKRADFGQVFEPTGHLPNVRPQVLSLQRGERGGRVTLPVDAGIARPLANDNSE